jgi:outer membrane protein TolC
MKIPAALFLAALLPTLLTAETQTLTLKKAIELALAQNPDLILQRLDEQRAGAQININKSPFSPSVDVGGGPGWAYGFPLDAPSVVRARTTMSLYNRPQSYLVKEAQEQQKSAGFGVEQKRDEVIFRVAAAYIDANNTARAVETAREQDAALKQVANLTQRRVDQDAELPLSAEKARVAERDAALRVLDLEQQLSKAERGLAAVLGLSPGDRVQTADDQIPALAPPVSQAVSVQAALDNSPELKRLDHDLLAKQMEIKSYQAYRVPKVDLIANYALLSKFDNYTEYYPRFRWNSAELGASFSMPLIVPRSAKAYIAADEIDAQKIRTQIAQTRVRIQNDIEDAFGDFRVADERRQVALEYLNLTRESTNQDLARLGDGQVLQAQVEQDRADEQERWRAYYDALAAAQHARLTLLRVTGTLQEALK